MWRSLSFMLYVGSISALDFLQIGCCFVLAPRGSAGVDGEASSHVAQTRIVAEACWALENVVLSLEIAPRACSEPHVRSKSQLGLVPEPTRPLAADMFLSNNIYRPYISFLMTYVR